MLTEEQKESLLRTGTSAFESISEMVEALEEAEETEDDDLIEAARSSIEEDPLLMEVRSGWCTSLEGASPEEFRLTLGMGGPAIQIVGEVRGGEPSSATLQVQDWLTPWVDHPCDEQILLKYASCFYFGG